MKTPILILGFVLASLMTAGCHTLKSITAGHAAAGIVTAQTPGTASGAGATVTGPANSAAPTTQVAERRVAYYPPVAPAGNGTNTTQGTDVAEVTRAPLPAAEMPKAPANAPESASVAVAAPAWLYEHTETTIGQHQDAAGILAKAAALAGGWSTMKWWGLIFILFGVAGLLWSAGHDEGYPLVFWKFVGCGAVFMIVGDNPLWLLLLVLPVGLYLMQKFNLLNLPGLPNLQMPGWLKDLATAGGPPAAGAAARPTAAGETPAKTS